MEAFPSSWLKCSFESKEANEEERQKEEEKGEISHDFWCRSCLPTSKSTRQAACPPWSQSPSQQNKPTGPFHSVGPLAWDQVMPLNKELLSCITSPQRGHPGRSLLSPGSASPQTQGLQHTGLFTAFCYSLLPLYHHYTNPVCRGRVLFQLSGGVNKRGTA